MTISVIISTYIKEKPEYLDAAMQSIWTDQLRKPDEIVLVKDGPLTPSLYAILDKWQKIIGEPLITINHSENKGLAESLNDAIATCTGDLIARMDSDDICLPERFLLQMQYMEQHPEVDILGGSIEEFNDEGTLSITRKYPQTMDKVVEKITKASPLAHPTTMFRRRFFRAGFVYKDKYRICEDITLWFDAVCGNRIINNIPETVLRFRRNEAMITRRCHEKAWSELRAYTNGINRLKGPFSIYHLYSLARLLFRLMPTSFVSTIYNSKIRKLITE